uniref:Uncharacterized protein n=1 Tax=Anguilla anguilla TaxID=7936 RepID=A0A0E9WBN4_ANGAN
MWWVAAPQSHNEPLSLMLVFFSFFLSFASNLKNTFTHDYT